MAFGGFRRLDGGTVTSTGGDATLAVTDPSGNATRRFRQHIGANQGPRTGSYSKTLTFTSSTTTP